MAVRMTRPLTKFGGLADKSDNGRHTADTITCNSESSGYKVVPSGMSENQKQSEVLILIECSGPEVDASMSDRFQTSKVLNNLSPEIEGGRNFSNQPCIHMRSDTDKSIIDQSPEMTRFLKGCGHHVTRRKSECPPCIRRQEKISSMDSKKQKVKAKSIERAVDVEKSTSQLTSKDNFLSELPARSERSSEGNIHVQRAKIHRSTQHYPDLRMKYENPSTQEYQEQHNSIIGEKQQILKEENPLNISPPLSDVPRRKSETLPCNLGEEPNQRRLSDAPPAIVQRDSPTLGLDVVHPQLTTSIPDSLNRLAIGRTGLFSVFSVFISFNQSYWELKCILSPLIICIFPQFSVRLKLKGCLQCKTLQ